jgi:DNA-binding transcriptional MerR regulator
MADVIVEVQGDHIEALTRVSRPIYAIEELIWNALDADATKIEVSFFTNQIGGIDKIAVKDDGSGIPREDAETAFKYLGGSWKKNAKTTRNKGRLLHGKSGKGRFKAFALGQHVEWQTTYQENGKLNNYRIQGSDINLKRFKIIDTETSTSDSPGTTVIISDIIRPFESLFGERARDLLSERLALYMREYPKIKIIYDDFPLDPSKFEKSVTNYDDLDNVEDESGKKYPVELTIIEWNISRERSLYLCDESGFVFSRKPPGIHARGFHFTAYLKSGFFKQLDESAMLESEGLYPPLEKIIESAKNRLRDHFRKRAAEESSSVIEQWKKEEIYPYMGEAENIIETAERQVFDVIALNVYDYLPDFQQSEAKTKRFSLNLIRQAIEKNPSALKTILEEILELPQEKLFELEELLKRTTLAAIINASKTVADRLDFLRGLETLLFDYKKELQERSQLHKILSSQTWIFGEEFHLSVNDQSLNEVLYKHLKQLGREVDSTEKVLRDGDKSGIIDMMLSKLVIGPLEEQRMHLVVELKRPEKKINNEVAGQVRSYAMAVAKDERFRSTNTEWVFWAVSNEVSEHVKEQARQQNMPEGVLYSSANGNLTIWVKEWGQIINECKARLRMFQSALQYEADRDTGLLYLQQTHEKYLPKSVLLDIENTKAKKNNTADD